MLKDTRSGKSEGNIFASEKAPREESREKASGKKVGEKVGERRRAAKLRKCTFLGIVARALIYC